MLGAFSFWWRTMDPFNVILRPAEYGDLAKVSPYLRSSWDAAQLARDKAVRYYSGEIFKTQVETETGEDGAPLLYPVGLNLVKMLVLAMTDAAYGEWEDPRKVLMFRASSDRDTTDIEKKAIEYATSLLEDSNAASMLWELEFDRNLLGAGVLRILPDLPRRAHVRWLKLPLDGFYPVFSPADPDELLECWQLTALLPEQAKQLYGLSETGNSTIVKVEHWTKSSYETTVDGKRMDLYSGVNPWGVVPFVYIPRMRTIDWWGESMADDIYAPQDEINARIADAGEALNYHSHPVFWGKNLPAGFDSKNFPMTPSAMWDLGRDRAGSHGSPEVGMLQASNPVAESVFKYVQFLYDWTRTEASAPPIAFGEDNGGGQRSGVTLEIRLWPMLKAIRRSRAYATTGFAKALQITGQILGQKSFSDVPTGVADVLASRRLTPVFNQVLPRDQSAIVDEVVRLLSTPIPAISLESAQMALGRGEAEVARIVKLMSQIEDWAPVKKALDSVMQGTAGKPNPSSAAGQSGADTSEPNGSQGRGSN